MNTVELIKILLEYKPSDILRKRKEELVELIPEFKACFNFDQKSKWHTYDVFEHILHVVDNVDNTPVLRIAALFHDVAKPIVYEEDRFGVGHFPNHWTKSAEIFSEFAIKNNLDNELIEKVNKLIMFHDLNFGRLTEEEKKAIVEALSEEEIELLFKFKKADLLAQNEEYYYLLDDYQKQKENILSKYERSSNEKYHI